MQRQEMSIDSYFTNGNYLGWEVEEVFEYHPEYIYWAIENEIYLFDEEALQTFYAKKNP